jgi:hypothetical protein
LQNLQRATLAPAHAAPQKQHQYEVLSAPQTSSERKQLTGQRYLSGPVGHDGGVDGRRTVLDGGV